MGFANLNICVFFAPGIFPQHVDLAQLQSLPPALLGQPLYPLGATGHPLLPPRANTHMQLAVMQQQLQQQQRPSKMCFQIITPMKIQIGHCHLIFIATCQLS